MEPITHILTGACLGRSGCNRKTAYATLAMTLAAESPDVDILWRLRGPVAALQHHRGITHSLFGAPFIALAVTGAVWLLELARIRYLGKGGASDRVIEGGEADPVPAAKPHRFAARIFNFFGAPRADSPVRWALVWLFSLVAALSHLLLDYTNNYGVRPFFPFNPRWYSWDIVFVVEPVLLAVLGLALVMPALLGLADREIGVGRTRFRGRGWAISALVFMVLFYALRNAEHAHAVELVRNAGITKEPIVRLGIEPYPMDPFKWHAIVETADYYQTATVHTRTDLVDTDPSGPDSGATLYKPAETAATKAAKGSWLGRAYLDWAGFPVVVDGGNAANVPLRGVPPPPAAAGWTAVHFEDLRFAYSPLGAELFSWKDPPLSGWVYVDASNKIELMEMDGEEQK